MNESKARLNSPQWAKWRASGAVENIDSAVSRTADSQAVLEEHAQEPARIKLPNVEIIRRRMFDAGLLSQADLNEILGGFATEISDRELIGPGLVMAWELNLATRGLDPVSNAFIGSMFNQVVDVIAPDELVVQEAKEFRQAVLDKLKAKRITAEPSLDELGEEDGLNDFERYLQVRRIGDIVHYYIDQDRENDIHMGDRREEEPNPYYNQTHRGFYLEFYYGMPSKLWTPWGEKAIGGSGGGGSFEQASAKILEALGAKLVVPGIQYDYGYKGPIYSLHTLDGVDLPEPVQRPRSQFREYKDVKQAWLDLTTQYYRERSEKPPLTVFERFALDDVILEERGRTFPPPNEFDVRTVEGLARFKGKVVKYTRDDGKTWHYTRLWDSDPEYFDNGSFGFLTDEEILPNIKVDARSSLKDEDFERGVVVRPAKPGEYEGIDFTGDSLMRASSL